MSEPLGMSRLTYLFEFLTVPETDFKRAQLLNIVERLYAALLVAMPNGRSPISGLPENEREEAAENLKVIMELALRFVVEIKYPELVNP